MAEQSTLPREGRLPWIDRMRGFAMLVMLLDHARTYFVNPGFHPLDPEKTHFFLYLTRWLAHLAAPAFVFLAGVSVFLKLGNTGKRSDISLYLLGRGIWLVLLEFTLIGFLWSFKLDRNFTFQVIGMLGLAMLVMPVFLLLPRRLVLFIGLAIIVGHNLLDRLVIFEHPEADRLFKLLHVYSDISFSGAFTLRIAYPFLPWLGIFLAGFGAGGLFVLPRARQVRLLLVAGGILLAGFVVLRLLNGYGNLYPFAPYNSLSRALYSFFNCSRYPPSLVFSLLIFSLLSWIMIFAVRENGRWGRAFWDRMEEFGRVPLFFYLSHLLLLHLLALAAFRVLKGDFVLNVFDSPDRIGFPLWTAWLVFVGTALLLIPLCRWFHRLKRGKWWRHLV